MRLFCEKKGAISVFLSLILLPMLIVALLANDAARIYCAKSVIADAGEMTMNAALSKYNDKLKDEYGLIAMDKQPSSMQKELEGQIKMFAPGKASFMNRLKKADTTDNAIYNWVQEKEKSCYICTNFEKTYERYLDTFFFMYKKDGEMFLDEDPDERETVL